MSQGMIFGIGILTLWHNGMVAVEGYSNEHMSVD